MVRWLTLFFALSALAQDFHNLEVIRVATTYRYTDGPAPSRGGEFLLFADVPSNRILKFTPGKGAETYRENAGGASGLVFDEKGRLLVCESTARRVVRYDPSYPIATSTPCALSARIRARERSTSSSIFPANGSTITTAGRAARPGNCSPACLRTSTQCFTVL